MLVVLKPGYIEFGAVCIHSAIVALGDTSAFVNPAGQLLTVAINSRLMAEWMTSA